MTSRQTTLALALVATLSSPSAFALLGGSADVNTADSHWAGVGAITINGNVFSGVMLDSTHMLTAAHVVAGQVNTAGNVSVSFNVGGDLTETLSASSISVYGGFTGTAPGPDGVWHDDLAVITLSTSITSVVPYYGLYGGSMQDKTITMVGYGGTGTGSTGVTGNASASLKTSGQNVVETTLVDDDGGTSREVFVFDFDGPTSATNVYGNPNPGNLTLGTTVEAQYAGGDSGSPVFVQVNGQWQLAGIGTFNGKTTLSNESNVLFGSIGGGTIVASYIPWINEQMAASVPEPQAWAMLLVGMGLVGAAVRLKART